MKTLRKHERRVLSKTPRRSRKREAKKAAKAVKTIANAAPEAEEAVTGKRTCGRKRKSAASAAVPKAKTARISETLVMEGEHEAGAQEPRVRAARTSIAHAEDETALEPYRAPVAQMR
ncbi:hypothetical protein PMIN02_000441 [Paraphaeosphaeria minitans]